VVFAFIAAWNEYIVALTLMSDPARQAAHGRHHVVRHRVRAALEPRCSRAAVIAIVPVVVLFALIERHLVGASPPAA
jgi:multiple sugar transport system permease protein